MEKKVIETQNEPNLMLQRAEGLMEVYEIDKAKDEFTIVQPYSDGNAIILSAVDEEDGRTLKVSINDTTLVLATIEGTLDVFTQKEG